MKTLNKSATGKAHGKIILIGEHAVVYGEPAIAFPFKAAPVKVKINKTETLTMIASSYYSGPLNEAPDVLANIKLLLETIGHDLDQPVENLSITITSCIPAERGMGSSAAVANAFVRALFNYFNTPLDKERLLYYVDISEKIAHGNPSGIDARVTGSEFPVFYKKGSTFEALSIHLSGYLIAADTGVKGRTGEAVADVARCVEERPEQTMETIRTIGQLTLQAKDALAHNALEHLGRLLTQAHSMLQKLTVSDDTLDHLVETAIQSGALGAKLTGGGRGGCMIALAQSEQKAKIIADKLLEQGAVNTWIHALGEDNNE
ncbi:mevalonate kinase [Alkalibacterium putridalgicola]|uniref:mevalonate kinase n=1 Tax=Alkalibacterium putridalgicola TaxID=426703 RepID=UPI0034CF2CCA